MKASLAVKMILGDLLVRGSESDFEADEVQDTIDMMNIYMASLDASGINVGYTAVSDLGDTLTVPDGALMGIISNTAVLLAPVFGVSASPELVQKAVIGLNAMIKLSTRIVESALPGTLPQGAGNDVGTYTDTHFFPDLQDTILTETGGSIALEPST